MSQTQNQRILETMKQGERLSSLVAFERFGCVSFPKRICEIRAQGHVIHDEKVKRNGKIYKEYFL